MSVLSTSQLGWLLPGAYVNTASIGTAAAKMAEQEKAPEKPWYEGALAILTGAAKTYADLTSAQKLKVAKQTQTNRTAAPAPPDDSTRNMLLIGGAVLVGVVAVVALSRRRR